MRVAKKVDQSLKIQHKGNYPVNCGHKKSLMRSSVGRVLDLGSKSHEFETHQGHCVVSLSKTLYPLLSTG